MIEVRPAQVLLEICDLVDAEVLAGTVSLPGHSFFAVELSAVQRQDRRDFLKNYICESMIALFLGVLDQARCMALILDSPSVAIGPYILMRGLLEYSYKIAYIADDEIDPEERIRRTLMLYITDIREYQRFSVANSPASTHQNAASSRKMADCWFRELTGKKLSTLSTKAIMDSVLEAGVEGVQKQDLGQNDVYEIGYRVGSAVVHGNAWAINLFCLETQSDAGSRVFAPRLQEPILLDKLILAARVLQSSFALVVQLGETLPASTMNSLERKIHELVAVRAAIQTN